MEKGWQQKEPDPPKEAIQTKCGPKQKRWSDHHGAKNTAEKLQKQWKTPQMQGHGDAPQEVESSPGWPPESCRREKIFISRE